MRRTRAVGAGMAALVVAALMAAGCGGGNSNAPQAQTTANAGQNQINPLPYAQVKQGGNLNWPIDSTVVNFNTNELDGNDLNTVQLMNATMPQLYLADAKNNLTYNPNYLTGQPKVTMSGGRQTVTYEINPKAKWSNGTPITAADFIAQWKALNGSNGAYKVVTTTGYDAISSVTQGSSPQEVIATFKTPFSEWWTVFSLLYPASTNNNPATFNTGWVKQPLASAGPFMFASQDTSAQTYTLKPNPNWWGQKPKLSSITFRVVDDSAQAAALQNKEIDFLDVGPNATTYKQVQGFPGVDLRTAGGPNFRHITINGSAPQLADLQTRQAIAMGINRTAIAKALLGPLGVKNPQPLNNHFYLQNQTGYQDNSKPYGTYNPTQAAQMLTQQGWVVQGGTRVNSGQVPATAALKGKTLKINLVIPTTVAVSLSEAQLIQQQLKQIQVEVDINSVDVNHFFDQFVATGAFDMTVFSYIGTSFPITGSIGIYQNKQGDSWNANFSRVGTAEIDNLMNSAVRATNPQDAIKNANTADAAIWKEVMVLPTYQRPDIWACNSNLVNFGAFGFQTIDYTTIGFKQ
jgi:peptide/nickel transport system substrate-binding protein